jgi:hypothetical protein
MQTVGKDAAPSIIAAQQIKSDLAAMHCHAARRLLGEPRAAADYQAVRQAITLALLDAAMNITYGESEKAPLRTLLGGVSEYEGKVAQARVLHDKGDADSLKRHREADALMRDALLPAADALDQANFEQLTRGYRGERTAAVWSGVWMGLSGLALLGALAGLQAHLARRTRRVLNPALAAATALALAGLVLAGVAVGREAALLKRAKEDAFDSIHALMQARAEAQDARGDTLRLLLDRGRAPEYGKAFDARAAKLVRLPPGLSPADLRAAVGRGQVPSGVEGYLADELRNITFAGEAEAARETLETYLRSADIDREVRRLADGGKQAEAVRLGLGDRPDQAGGAFTRFDEALGKTLRINRDEFDRAVDRGFAALAGFDIACPVVGLGVALLAYLGLRPRLKEYDVS